MQGALYYPANYEAARVRMGGDNLMTKMWWDGGN